MRRSTILASLRRHMACCAPHIVSSTPITNIQRACATAPEEAVPSTLSGQNKEVVDPSVTITPLEVGHAPSTVPTSVPMGSAARAARRGRGGGASSKLLLPRQNPPAAEGDVLLQRQKFISGLTAHRVSVMTPHQLLEAATQYIQVCSVLQRMAASRLRTTRLRHSVLRKAIRFHPQVRQMLFLRVITAVEGNLLTTNDAVGLLSCGPWPFPLAQCLGHLRRIVAARISHASHVTQQQKLHQSDTTEARSEANDDNFLTPKRAREYLNKLALAFARRPTLIGPLATIGWQDISVLGNANEIVSSMWAVHSARTHAPDSFWRQGIRRLAALRREGGATRVPVSIIYRALRVCKRERWSGDIATLSYLTSEAVKDIMHNFATQSAESNGAIARPISPQLSHHRQCVEEAERRVALITGGLTPRRFFSLLVIAGELGHTFHGGFEAMGAGVLAPTIKSLKNESEVTLVCEVLRVTGNDSPDVQQALLDLLVRVNGADGVEARKQSPSDEAPVASEPEETSDDPRQQSKQPKPMWSIRRLRSETIPVIELAMRTVVRTPNFVHKLHLQPFIRLLLGVSREKRKFSPSTMLSFTDNMYHIHRQLSKSSPMGAELRAAVDEFAFQFERMLHHGVVSVGCVNKFLEYSIMLDMKGRTDDYPHTASLRATRGRLYEEAEAAHLPFHGIIASHPLRKLVIDPYQDVYHATIKLGYYHHPLPKSLLDQIQSTVFEHGVFAGFEATRLYRVLHYERASSRDHPTVRIPEVVARQVAAACAHRALSCGLGEHAAVRSLSDDVLHERLAIALRTGGAPMDHAIVDMTVHAVVNSPIRHVFAEQPRLRTFLFALVRSPFATDTHRMQIHQMFDPERKSSIRIAAAQGNASGGGTASGTHVDGCSNTEP